MNYQELLCSNIKLLRTNKNMTQAKFAELIGLSVEAVRNIEHQRYTPSARTIDTICEKFNISYVDLLIPNVLEVQNSMINAINEKLKDCAPKELDSISTMIDVIRATYRHN